MKNSDTQNTCKGYRKVILLERDVPHVPSVTVTSQTLRALLLSLCTCNWPVSAGSKRYCHLMMIE